MASEAIEEYRKNAEIYHGDALCKQKSVELLEKLSLPNGLLPLQDIVEADYNRSAGLLRQSKSPDHFFSTIGRTVSYANEIKAFVEDRRMKKITGVKSKELFIWLTVCNMSIEDQWPLGRSRSRPLPGSPGPFPSPPSNSRTIIITR